MTDTVLNIFIPDEAHMIGLGKRLAPALKTGCVVYLHGEMGTGKTTLVRGILQGLGYEGRVKSPTYTLVEPYDINDIQVYHFDLYRLGNPEELEFMGIRDYYTDHALILVEWPERGCSVLPPADLDIVLDYQQQGRLLTATRLTDRAVNCFQLLSIDS